MDVTRKYLDSQELSETSRPRIMFVSKTRAATVTLGLLACLFAGVAVVFLPPFWFTLAIGFVALLFVMVRPYEGLFLVLLLLYFPLFPVVPFGPLEFSATAPLTLGLLIGTLNLQRRDASLRFARWQVALLAALGSIILLTILFSESLRSSLYTLPNWAVYWMLLYVCMLLVRKVEQLWALARFILVLAFILSIWRVELEPLRELLNLPSLGINGAVFAFHPAFAIAMVIAFILFKSAVSLSWRVFSWLTLSSLVYHGVLYQTRAGWLVWILMAAIVGWQTRGYARLVFAFGVMSLALGVAIFFSNEVSVNIEETQSTVRAVFGETSYSSASSDDRIRLLAYDAGLRMFSVRPILGWGPGAYFRLKPEFVRYIGKESNAIGAFDSWLIVMTEMGLVGMGIVLALFLLPMPLTGYIMNSHRNLGTMLAFAFALGALGLSIHLLFIDLLYSFAWVHAGLALAASRLVLEAQTIKS